MDWTRRSFIKGTGVGLMASVLGGCSMIQRTSKQQPNFIVIFIDDQGYQDLGVFGSPNIKTPNIDRMASEGMRFTDFYSAAPVCTPSRAALLTGCYPERVGDLEVLFPYDRHGLNPKETTIAKMLKKCGYATACVGKWHLGHLPEVLPMRHGFDSYFGIPYSNDMTTDVNMKLSDDIVLREGATLDDVRHESVLNRVPLMRDDEVIEYPADQSTLTRRYTEEAIRFIGANQDRPFFLYLPHTMPHIPLYASRDFEGTSDAGLYGDCIEEIDWSVGRILETLKTLGLDDNTLVIYTSDNGPWDLPGSAQSKVKGNMNRRVGGSAAPLRGFKFSTWEGGMREPTVMRWPGHIPAGRVCRELAGTIDVLPTIAALAGAPLPKRTIDGKSIVPLIEGRPGAVTPHDAYFYELGGVRSGKWKLKDGQLFDLQQDISERQDVADQYPGVVERLTKLLLEHKKELAENARRPWGTIVKKPEWP